MTPIAFRACAVAIISLSAATVSAQNILQFRAEAIEDAEQAGIKVVAMDPVSMGAVVTGAPYSAEAVTEVTQTLSDGNRIERQTSATIARSSDGRIRREQNAFAVGALVAENPQPVVTISDPKSGVHLTLNYDRKVAFRMKPPMATVTATTPEGGTVTWSSDPLGSRAGAIRPGRRATFERAQPVGPPPPPLPPPGAFDEPMVAFGAVGTAAAPWNAEHKSEQLEPRTIEGLRAEGTRTTLTIPAGVVGNALPIEIVNERWYSPDLQVVLMTRRSDPRFGETIYRLVNIVQAEPAADLFKVPADFRIEDFKP
jgi:hypothetical protein